MDSGTGGTYFLCILKTTSVTTYSSASASYLEMLLLLLLLKLYHYDLCFET